MTSVINSARVSTASLLDVVTKSAGTALKTLDSAHLAADALHIKATVWHHGVAITAKTDMELQTEEILHNAAARHVEIMVNAYATNYPNKKFDRSKAYTAAYKRCKAALTDK